MQLIDLEVVGGEEVAAQAIDHRLIHAEHPAAPAALHVSVMVLGKVVHRRFVTEVDVLHQPNLAQGPQRPVDGGQVELRMLALEPIGQILGADVCAWVGGELGEHQPPCRRHPAATAAKVVD